MKIWVIGRSFPTEQNNLRGSFEWEQATLLARRGHAVTYLACVFHHQNRVRRWGLATWQENGVDVFCYSQRFLPERIPLHCSRLRQKRWFSLLQQAEEQGGLPDVIHLHYPSMLCEPEVLEHYQNRGVKIVVTEHWSRVLNRQLRSYERARLVWQMHHADSVSAVGVPLATAMRELTGSNREMAILPNVINPLFVPSPKQPDGVFRFVTVGRLVPLRQYDKVIETFDRVFHGRRDVTLTLIGKGSEYRRLQALIRRREAQDNIVLAGMLSRAECAKAVAGADCVVCYSRYETFGVPIIEGWGCGVPVIVPTQLGFLNGPDGNRRGIAVDTDDAATLRRAMEEMVQSTGRFSTTDIAAYARAHYSEEAVYAKLLALYEE